VFQVSWTDLQRGRMVQVKAFLAERARWAAQLSPASEGKV
jgi:hypothetical protein